VSREPSQRGRGERDDWRGKPGPRRAVLDPATSAAAWLLESACPLGGHHLGGHHDVALGVSDVDHGYYADHSLTVARHPGETDERIVVRR